MDNKEKWIELGAWHDNDKQDQLESRRVTISDLEEILNGKKEFLKMKEFGRSFEGRPLYSFVMGSGKINVLIWTQMHGNESTGTRAILDLVKWMEGPGALSDERDEISGGCTVHVLPVLNPDGAQNYTRISAQGIDLNRDVVDKRAPESILLQKKLKEIDPDFCFNLHDQRTIFSVGDPAQTATLSFLAPSEDEERTITVGRIRTMRVISAIFGDLNRFLPGRIGRYTDEFYPTATGDNFQKMGYPTILIESGHSPGDYGRAVSRKMTFISLVSGLLAICRGIESVDHRPYFDIPENEKKYIDILVRSATLEGKQVDLGILYKEVLKNHEVQFVPTLDQVGQLRHFEADRKVDGSHLEFSTREDAEKWIDIEFI